MGPFSWIIVGFVAGALAQRALGLRRTGCLTTILIGVAGALLGGVLFRAAGDDGGFTHFGLKALVVAFVGSGVLLLLLGPVLRRRS